MKREKTGRGERLKSIDIRGPLRLCLRNISTADMAPDEGDRTYLVRVHTAPLLHYGYPLREATCQQTPDGASAIPTLCAPMRPEDTDSRRNSSL
jgi:hypothetical protein